MKDTKANQRKFPLEAWPWLASLPANTDFQEIADHYGITRAALLNVRCKARKAEAKRNQIVGNGGEE